MMDTCAYPGCTTKIRDENVTNVCRVHIHTEQCQCLQCLGAPKPRFRIRTRAELVSLGLLPEQRIF